MLAAQERRALEALSHGLTLIQAGEVLGYAPDTIKQHLLRARRALRAKNTAHAIAIAIRQGEIH